MTSVHAPHSPTNSPRFLHLVAHNLRWRLLSTLVDGDHHVAELVAILGEPQNLVSYHLRLLRDSGLITSHRSTADGRQTYYRLDLDNCRRQWTESGRRLHPGLIPQPTGGAEDRSGLSLLFLCTGNSSRSQLAEAIARDLTDDTVDIASAGSHPKKLHPQTIRFLRRCGAELHRHRPTPVEDVARRRFTHVITLCDKVKLVCPEFPGAPRRIHWSTADPAAADDVQPAFQHCFDELHSRVEYLLAAERAAQAP